MSPKGASASLPVRLRASLSGPYERLGTHLPEGVLGTIDPVMPYRRPMSAWRGPMNGQQIRQEIVRDLAKDLGGVELVIETGSFRGFSTGFLQRTFGCQVWTVESNRRWYAHTRARFLLNPQVTVRYGDSREQLRQLAMSSSPDVPVFAYLDAHWQNELPLREELAIIAETWQQAAVMIDDFQVAHDPGYGFDDYGPGMALTAEYLEASDVAGWRILYPAAASARETGPRRGCCLLLSPAFAAIEPRGFRN